MGKKSLIKSTSKKRAPQKAASAAKTKKKAAAKKAAPAKKPAAKSSPAKKAPPAPKAQPVSIPALLKKQFAVVTPKTLYTVPKKMVAASTFTAPELLAGYEAKDAQRIKGILTNKYSESDLIDAAKKAAAEKAAAEKAAAEKAAAEKAAAEKAAAEKAAAEKAAAEKAAAEKAAAEKAAAEKAAAEKAAAEKAAAEKAAAEKAAAEKAAAEKAAAEKAAAEKAAAEKAAAEKAAAEKAESIKKAAAQKSEVKVTYEPLPAQAEVKKPSDPVDNAIKLFAAGMAFLILLVVGASASNSFKYHLSENQGALEIWKGKFAPMGKKLVIALPGVPAPEDLKTTYSANDVYPLVFHYYIDKADALLDVPGIPDFEGIKSTLKTALEYGATNALRTIAYERLDTIDRLILFYKADVAASRGTIDDLTSAVGFLKEAGKLTTDKAQKEVIAQQIAAHTAAIGALEEQAATQQAAAEAEAARQAEAVVAGQAKAPEEPVKLPEPGTKQP